MIRDVLEQLRRALFYVAELAGDSYVYGDGSILPLHGVCVLPRRQPREPDQRYIRHGIADIESFLADLPPR